MGSTASALLLGATMLLAGCALGQDVGAPPATLTPTAPASPSTSEAARPTGEPSSAPSVSGDEADVLAAYQAFYAAVDQAQGDPPKSQDYLAPVATGAQFEITNGAIKAAFLAGEEDLGSPLLNPTVHSIDGDTATVYDCQDTSTVQSRDRSTGEVLTIGSDPDSATTVLTRVDGVWLVSATDFPDDNAAYC